MEKLIPIRQYADTYANLTASNLVFLERQLIIESDKGRAKLGDGITDYNTLPYVFGAPGTGVSGIVANYAALPAANTVTGEFYAVTADQGTAWLPGGLGGTYYAKGLYYSDGTNWIYMGNFPYQATQLDVDAGVITDQFVSPATLAASSQWNTKVSSVTGPAVDNTDPLNPVITIPTNLTFYSTTAASDIPTYNSLVIDINDPDYDSPAVNVPTGAITGLAQPVGVLVSDAGVFAGNPGTINLVTVGEIRRTSGTGVAEFYFEVYQRDSLGAETLVATSNATAPVNVGTYTEFSASCLLNNGNWLSTDRVVLKYYGNRISGGSDPSYEFSFGGTNPVRTLFPISASLLLNVPIAIGVTGVTGGTPGNVLSVSPSGLLSQTTVNSGSGATGQVTFWSGTNTQSGDNGLFWDNTNKRLGIGTITPSAKEHIVGSGTTSATTALQVQNSAATDNLVVKDNGSIEIGKNTAGTTQSTASITVTSADTDTGLALVTKGSGSLVRAIPDATSVGGNARGTNCVDLQANRGAANQVASGPSSTIGGGGSNRASGSFSTVSGGTGNSATNQWDVVSGGRDNATNSSNGYATIGGGVNNTSAGTGSTVAGGQSNSASGTTATVAGGLSNTSSGSYSFIGGGSANVASSNYGTVISSNGAVAGGQFSTVMSGRSTTATDYTTAIGYYARAYLYGSVARASGKFSGAGSIIDGQAQTSDIRFRQEITGTAKTELFLDGASLRAILLLITGSPTGRLWNAKVQIAAICTTQGNGTVTAGEAFIGNYAVGISRIGSTTSLIGTVQNLHTPQTSTNMADAVVDITADDTNEALKIEFTPPTTAGSTTVIRVVATVYLTEVGY